MRFYQDIGGHCSLLTTRCKLGKVAFNLSFLLAPLIVNHHEKGATEWLPLSRFRLLNRLTLVETRQTRYTNKAREARLYRPDSHQ